MGPFLLEGIYLSAYVGSRVCRLARYARSAVMVLAMM